MLVILAVHLRDRHVFIWQSQGILKVFKTLTLKHVFRKTKTFLKKLEYHFLVQSTLNESALFPCKTALSKVRISHPGLFLGKGILKISRKFTGEHSCREVILIWNATEIALRHRWFPVNLLHIFRTPFPKNTSGSLVLKSHFKANWMGSTKRIYHKEWTFATDSFIFLKIYFGYEKLL